MSDQNPYFSVITPSWNQGKYLKECIESVLRQDDPGFEHLIFDNCSTDSTREVLGGYTHLSTVVEKDRGQSDAINKGFLAAEGEIICWLNSDDAYPDNLFARLRDCFADPGINVVFGDVLQKNYDGSADQIAMAKFERREYFIRWWSSRVKLHQPAIFFRRKVMERIGLLRDDLHFVMDYEYWWRMSEHYRFHYLSGVLAVQHRQPDSKTIKDWPRVYEERSKVFAPYYGMIEGGSPLALVQERRKAMANNYLRLAWSAPARSHVVWDNMIRAIAEDPSSAARPSLLGLITRAIRNDA